MRSTGPEYFRANRRAGSPPRLACFRRYATIAHAAASMVALSPCRKLRF